MGRRKVINQATIPGLVYKELEQLPPRYVYVMDFRKSLGPGNVNIGGTKFELIIKVFDTDKENWTHQPGVYERTFEDSDGTTWWGNQYADFLTDMKYLKER
jgi:hypothetical protein